MAQAKNLEKNWWGHRELLRGVEDYLDWDQKKKEGGRDESREAGGEFVLAGC